MARWVPFTAYFRVVPHRGQLTDQSTGGVVVGHRGSRFDYIRDLQRLAVAMFEEIFGDDPNIIIGRYGQNTVRNMIGSLDKAVGVVPQFGNKPSLLSFEGLMDADGARIEDGSPEVPVPLVAPRITTISNNRVYKGYCGEQPWLGTAGAATSDVLLEVALLRQSLLGSISVIYDSSNNNPTLWKLKYNGIDFGVGGHHFPL